MLKPTTNLKPRDLYLNRLKAFRDTEPVKVIIGIRRCGKSSLLRLMQQYLLQSGIGQDQIISMNFESMEFRNLNCETFYAHVKSQVLPDKKMYLFFDELQRLDRWEDAVNSFRVDFDCDIYITGSNAYLLSSEYATYLSGRYVEIKMLPLSFKEFVCFHGYECRNCKVPGGGHRLRAFDSEGDQILWDDLLETYLHYGGMPGIADVGLSQDKAMILLDGIYSTVVIRDILERQARRGQQHLGNPVLLRKIVLFLADNIGNSTSLNSISNTLTAEKLLSGKPPAGKAERTRIATQTVAAYVAALKESYLFSEIKRFDIKGKAELKTLGKYYIADHGLRNYLLGFRNQDRGHVIENVVYLELQRRGFDVAVGKIGDKEIDFIATQDEARLYIQVTDSLGTESVMTRELAPLRAVRDNYEKMIITATPAPTASVDGIRIVRLTDFLLGQNTPQNSWSLQM